MAGLPRVRVPRWTVRLRLTLVYGALFVVCGTAVLLVTFFLVRHAVIPHGAMKVFQRPVVGNQPSPGEPLELPQDAVDFEAQTRDALAAQRRTVLHELLVQSGFALALVVVLALALGWWLAGRILRPLRTVTSAAQEVSAADLHRRLALPGPDDELKELGDTFDALLARLEASFHAQRQFVANASHELRTPLARQRVIGQVALDDPEATVSSLRAAHERIIAAGRQQERLIDALLTLARGHAGLSARHAFDLAEVVADVTAVAAAETADAREPGAPSLRTTIDPCPVSGDRALAERLVTNLVDNAIRHNVPDGWVEVTCAPGVLTVANTGPVVPQDAVERLFQPFQRLTRARTGPGLGLGLSIVRAIAEAHDAAVDARPRAEGGLVVTVVFDGPQAVEGDAQPEHRRRFPRLLPRLSHRGERSRGRGRARRPADPRPGP